MRKTPLKTVLDTAIEYFDDKDIALKWWMTALPEYGNKTPYQISKEGNGIKLVKTMQAQIKGNKYVVNSRVHTR